MSKDQLDPRSEATLKNILEKDLNDITPSDEVFLRARRSYIGKRSQERLKHILDNKKAEPVNTSETVVKDDAPTSDHPADEGVRETTPAPTQPEDDGVDE